MPQRSYPLPPVSLFFVSHLLPKAFFELSVCLTPICTHNYNMDRAAHRGVTEEGGLTAAAAPAAAAAGLIFQSLSLPLLCNIDVANTMLLLPTDAPTGRPAGVAGRLPSAQTVTQTRRLLRFGDTNTMDGRTDDGCRHRRLQKSPIEGPRATGRKPNATDRFFPLILDASARRPPRRGRGIPVVGLVASFSRSLARCN